MVYGPGGEEKDRVRNIVLNKLFQQPVIPEAGEWWRKLKVPPNTLTITDCNLSSGLALQLAGCCTLVDAISF